MMEFDSLCELFENIKNAKGIAEKTSMMKSFMKSLRHHDKNFSFQVLRLILPKLDRERDSYRIKESKISKLIIKMLDLPQGNDRNLLVKSIISSDFGEVIFSVLKKYIVGRQATLSVQNLNDYLDKIAKRESDNGLDDLFLEILRKMSAKNTKWFVQIVLKNVKLGLSDKNILNCFHEDGATFYDNTNNLRKICEILWDWKVKIHELEIKIFDPFRPMLSKRCDASNFKKCFPESKAFIIENKFDGERFQLHMKNGEFKYFSRNSFNYTDTFGATCNEGEFSSRLTDVFGNEVEQIILDGEMMIWNKNTQSFGSKGMNLDVKKLRKGKYQSCYCVFDILLYNDKVLTNQPLNKRVQILRKAIKNQIMGTIIISEFKVADNLSDIVDALNSSVDKSEEGIVVKDFKSVYKCGDRNSGWFKVKMEYFDDVVHDLDVLLMGGLFGSNNQLNSFIIGVFSGSDTFKSFGRISSGLNKEQLELLNEKLKTCGTDFKLFSTQTEGKLLFGRDTPDIYIEPQNSYVLQIRATELIRSTTDDVKTPYTLRFPRVLKLREDKRADECFSISELLELADQNKAVIKLNKRHIELNEITSKSGPAKKVKLDVIQFKHQNNMGKFLEGKKFHVHSGDRNWTVEDICNSLKRAGGEVIYRLGSDVDIVLVSHLDKCVTEMLKQPNNFDIINIGWLQRVFDSKKLVEYKQNEIVSCGYNFKSNLCCNFDMYGDSFKEETSREALERICDTMKKKDEFFNVNDVTVFSNTKNFSSYIAYFDAFEEISNPDSKKIYSFFLDEVHFQYYRGLMSKVITADVNLIITFNDERKDLLCKYLSTIERGLNDKVKIVSRDFLY